MNSHVPHTSRSRTRRAGFTLGAFALLGALTSTNNAHAQGWALNRYQPTPGGDPFFAGEYPIYSGSRTVAPRFGITGDYGLRPLVARQGSTVTPIVEHEFVLHAQATLALLNRFDINLSVPVVLLNAGPSAVQGSPVVATNAPGLSDIRLGARVRIIGDAARDPASLHIGAQVYSSFLSLNPANSVLQDQGFSARGHLTVAGRSGSFRYGVTAGFHGRPSQVVTPNMISMGHELYANAVLGASILQDRLWIGAEAFAATNLERMFTQNNTNLEGLVGVHYYIADTLLVGVGGGMGLLRAPGTPLIRGLLHIAYAPLDRPPPERPAAGPVDTDRDGVVDSDDQCINEPAGTHPDPERRGCPLRDRDGDGVFDNEDRCVDTAQGEHPDPSRAGCPRPDTDSDGVFDDEDQCVNTAAGEHPDPERRGCPDGDDDHDNVLNHGDQCPREAAGLHPDPARAGCPLPDRDHDNVPDATDHCPDRPGAPNTNPQLNGCPGLLTVGDGALRITRPVFFATNRDTILPRSFPVLRAIREALAATPEIRRVSIEGHTDDVGDDERNMDLSNRRAQSVVRWLTTNGIAVDRLEAHGFGETRPLQPITGLTGAALNTARSQNRRVDFRIVDPAQPNGEANITTRTSTTTTTTTTTPTP